jgi:hypothetical protein
VNDHDQAALSQSDWERQPPLIRIQVTPVSPGLFKVETPDSQAVLADRTRQPIKAACEALRILGWGPACLLGILPLPLSIARDL